jgi:hypothetical protein
LKFGDECTKFFHTNASIKHRRNTITTLRAENGQKLSTHEDKANLLWTSFKNRMGTSEFFHVYLNLSSLLAPLEGLDFGVVRNSFHKRGD